MEKNTKMIDTYALNPAQIDEKQTALVKRTPSKKSFWEKCVAGWNAGLAVADGTVTLGFSGVAHPNSQVARGMLAGGQALQMAGAVGAIVSGVPGWVTALLIGGNSSILGGFILGLKQGTKLVQEQVAVMETQAKQMKEQVANMSPEDKEKLVNQFREAINKNPEMADAIKDQAQMFGITL